MAKVIMGHQKNYVASNLNNKGFQNNLAGFSGGVFRLLCFKQVSTRGNEPFHFTYICVLKYFFQNTPFNFYIAGFSVNGKISLSSRMKKEIPQFLLPGKLICLMML